MGNVMKIAGRNLLRYRRRTALTLMLISLGIVAVLLFVSVAGSFRALMVGQITDSMLGHVQVHKRGYVASIDNLPLNLNMPPQMLDKLDAALADIDGIEAVSKRLKFGAMFSNFTETTNIRLNAVVPADEMAAAPLLKGRLLEGDGAELIAPGKILIPELLAKGMKVGLNDEVVLVATNQDGSVNGRAFSVGGILGSVTGPGGRDGYIHIDDARQLLRIPDAQISEVVLRLKDPGRVEEVGAMLKSALAEVKTKNGEAALEIHPWMDLTPFYNIARMIDMLTLFIQVMLVSIVLISVMNVMMMAVYERIREIGAIAAIGTRPGTILSLFVTEGFLMGVLGSAVGTVISLVVIVVLNNVKISFAFGREILVLEPTIDAATVIVACATVIVMSVLASLQPAWKAARMDPIDALRHV